MNKVRNERMGSEKAGCPGNMGPPDVVSFCDRQGCARMSAFCLVVSVRSFLGGSEAHQLGSSLHQPLASLTPSLWAPQHSGRKGQCPNSLGEWTFLGEERIQVSGGLSIVISGASCSLSFRGHVGVGHSSGIPRTSLSLSSEGSFPHCLSTP